MKLARTPIMPILNGIEILEEKLAERKKDFEREIDIITRNASRLQNLAESILQVSKIESGSFNIDKQNKVDFHNLISQVIEDIEKKYAYTDKTNRVSIICLPFYEKDGNIKDADVTVEEKKDTKAQFLLPPFTLIVYRKRLARWFLTYWITQ